MRDFWLPLISANHLPDSAFIPKVFDPKVIYDPGSRRFVAVTLDGRLPTDNSWILLAVSQFSDPTLGWNTWAIPVDNTGATWADYPGLGIDNNAVFVTANMFNAADPPVFQRGKVWRIPKGQLLVAPPAATLNWTEFTSPEFNLQPAHTFGTAPAEYFLTEGNIRIIGGRYFFVDLQVLAVTESPPALVSVGAVPITQYPFLDNGLPVAPNDKVDTGDTRIQNVVYRNGHLYATHTVSNSTASKTEVAWYEIAPSPTPTLVQQGRISDASRFYYYPSIAVNAKRDIAIGFSGSSPADFPGAYYTARVSTDTPGFTQPVGILKAGEAAYFKTFGTATDPNRWGDYSATVVDPADDITFWTIQEYARPTAGTFPNTGRWGTWWGSFRMTAIAAPGNLNAIATGPFQVLLSWIRQSTNETGYRVERSPTGVAGSFVVITPSDLAAGTTSYTDNSVLPGNTYYYRVQSFNATDNAYSITASATTPPDIAPPYNLTATLLSGPMVMLAWVDNATNTNTLNIVVERKTGASGIFSPISPLLPSNSTTYTDNSALAPGTLYTYRVGAVSSLSTAYSEEVSVTTPVVPTSSDGGGGGGGCLSTAESPSGGNPLSQAISIGSLLLPVGAIFSRKLLVRGWRKIRLRHPVC